MRRYLGRQLGRMRTSVACEIAVGERRYLISACSDGGPVRHTNEDSFQYGLIPSRSTAAPQVFAAVADGVASRPDGRFASEFAVQQLAIEIWRSQLPADQLLSDAVEVVNRCLQLKNRLRSKQTDSLLSNRPAFAPPESILVTPVEQPEPSPATTLVAALFDEDWVQLVSVGDSGVYRYHGGRLTRVFEADASAGGGLTQWIGKADIAPRQTRQQMASGDVLLLCSDGLSGVVDEALIIQTLQRSLVQRRRAKPDDGPAPAEQLVDLALHRQTRDNVTAVVIRLIAPKPQATGGESALLVIVLIALVLAVVLVLLWVIPR